MREDKYTQYSKPPKRIADNWIRDSIPNINDDAAELLYTERIRFLEIFVTSMNNSAASIIKRRNFYSSKRTTDNDGYQLKKEKFKNDDLVRVMLHISKVEIALHANREYTYLSDY